MLLDSQSSRMLLFISAVTCLSLLDFAIASPASFYSLHEHFFIQHCIYFKICLFFCFVYLKGRRMRGKVRMRELFHHLFTFHKPTVARSKPAVRDSALASLWRAGIPVAASSLPVCLGAHYQEAGISSGAGTHAQGCRC